MLQYMILFQTYNILKTREIWFVHNIPSSECAGASVATAGVSTSDADEFRRPSGVTECQRPCVAVSRPGVCFTNVSRALQDILLKFVYCRNRSSYENFKLKLCTCAQSMALGTRTKFQLEILTINVISIIVYFREIILESSRNVSGDWRYWERSCQELRTTWSATKWCCVRPVNSELRPVWAGVVCVC